MIESPDTNAEERRIDAIYRAKARAEVEAAEALVPDADVVRAQGDLLADVLLVKGTPGAGDVAKGRALAGEDGTSIGKALDALGLPPARFAVCTRIGANVADRSRRLRLLTEAIDPRIVILLDHDAAADFGKAYGTSAPTPGELVRVLGREVLALDGFEASLADEKRKRRVWGQLRALERPQKA